MLTVLVKRCSGCITSCMKTRASMCGTQRTQPVKIGKLFSSDFSNIKMPKMMKVHATCNETKRILSLQKGGEVKELRHLVLQGFSDVLLDKVSPADVKLQRYDPSFEDYVELNSDEKLEDDIKIRALVSKQDKQGSGCKGHVSENCHVHAHLPHFVIPWYPILKQGEEEPSVFKIHPINANLHFRLWSPVSNGLMQRDPENPSEVNCKGAFGINNAPNTVIKAKFLGQNVFHLVYSEAGSDLYITAIGEGQEIVVEPTPKEESKFEPDYYWGKTVFKSIQYNTLYLGCDENRKATLVPMEDPRYPNPQALFIVNKYNPILPTH